MARIRSIKPELHSSESLSRCSRDARWLFVGLFTLADDYGRLRDLPKQVAGDLFPHEDDITGEMVRIWMDELIHVGCVNRYRVDGKRYLYLPGWHDHQKISKPTDSRIPEPPEISHGSPEFPGEIAGTPGQCGIPQVEVGSRKLEVGSCSGQTSVAESAPDAPQDLASRVAGRVRNEAFEGEFMTWWEHYPRHIEKRAALGKYKATRRKGATADDLLAAVKHFAEHMLILRRSKEHIKHGSTFLGPDEPWTDYVEGVPEEQTSNGHDEAVW